MGEEYTGLDRRDEPRLNTTEHEEWLKDQAKKLFEAVSLGKITKEVFVAEQVTERVRLEGLAWTDPLTGLRNRRAFDQELGDYMAIARRHGLNVSVIVLDIDHFKKFNDDNKYGHSGGDEVLKRVASVLLSLAQGDDNRNFFAIYRLGGEEMGVIALDLTNEALVEVVKTIGLSVSGSGDRMGDIGNEVARLGGITVSVGATVTRGDDSPKSATDRADQLMYNAKRTGEDGLAGRKRGFVEGLDKKTRLVSF